MDARLRASRIRYGLRAAVQLRGAVLELNGEIGVYMGMPDRYRGAKNPETRHLQTPRSEAAPTAYTDHGFSLRAHRLKQTHRLIYVHRIDLPAGINERLAVGLRRDICSTLQPWGIKRVHNEVLDLLSFVAAGGTEATATSSSAPATARRMRTLLSKTERGRHPIKHTGAQRGPGRGLDCLFST